MRSLKRILGLVEYQEVKENLRFRKISRSVKRILGLGEYQECKEKLRLRIRSGV